MITEYRMFPFRFLRFLLFQRPVGMLAPVSCPMGS
jgi:hypothetical protein